MAIESWLGAKRSASICQSVVFHNLSTGKYGACPLDQSQGHFDERGKYTKDRCLYFPAKWTIRRMEEAELASLHKHPLFGEEVSEQNER